jgi:type II secretory pathway pseudopilin PulG
MRRLAERGDTIVEVLIAMLVVSTILGGAFVSARRSQTTILSTQERVEALKAAEAQLERIKYVATTPEGKSALFAGGDSWFCYEGTNNTRRGLSSLPVLEGDNFDNPARCQSSVGGVVYHSAVERRAGTNTFFVYTRWDGVGGIGKQQVQLVVRIDP